MKEASVDFLSSNNKVIAVVGLGYTGLPLAMALAEYFSVTGFDTNTTKVNAFKQGLDLPDHFLTSSARNNIRFTSDPSHLNDAVFYIVTVPTPVNEHRNPDLSLLDSAMQEIGKVLKRGGGVVIESTVYPGCTEEFCVPILEKFSGLRLHQDFWVGYSPERINPGDSLHHVRNVVKLIAGSSTEAIEVIQKIYSKIVTAGLHICSSIKIAEAAKMTENIQRDVNIALLNELSQVYENLGIDSASVWEAAATKWNFAPFKPGLAGGHCISVDPYYLLYRARVAGIEPRLVATARSVNEQTVERVVEKVVTFLHDIQVDFPVAQVLVKGITFKGNVGDMRNSKILEVVKLLKERGIQVDLEDPLADETILKNEYGWKLTKNVYHPYQVVIVAADHTAYNNLGEDYFCAISSPQAIIMDLKGLYKGKITQRKYWSL